MMLTLAACDDTSDLGVMQTNPQEPVLTPAGVLTVSTVQPVSGGQVVLGDYENSTIPAVQYAFVDSVIENGSVNIVMQVASKEDFSDAIDIPLQSVAGSTTCSVDAKSWDDAFRRLLGKAPAAKTNYVRYAAYLQIGSQISRIGTEDTWYGQTEVTVTPVDLGIHVEEAYYLVGTVNNWDLATAIKFEHSDKNVYDDPIFTLAIDITADQAAGGWWWKIVPESAFKEQSWSGLYGVEKDGDTAASGNLFADGNSGMLVTPGQQLFTIDMLSCTYSVTNAVPQLYTPGNSNGWSIDGSSILATSDYTNYTGFLYLNGEWLLLPAANWDNKYAAGTSDNTIVFNGASNLPCPAQGAGLYWTSVNLGNLTYTTDLISSLSVIGGFNDWNGDVDLTPSADFLTWTGTVTFAAETEWKIRANHDWAISLGGDADNMEYNGGNLISPAGTYTMTLDLHQHPYKVTLTK